MNSSNQGNSHQNRVIDPQILAEACDWLLDIEASPAILTSAKFEAWLRAHPEHVRAFNHVANTWQLGSVLSVEANSLDQPIVPPSPQVISIAQRRPAKSLSKVLTALAATVCLLVFSLSLLPTTPASNNILAYQTQQGEIQQLQLSDSSALYLDSSSRVRVQMQDKRRDVELIQGRVFSQVAHQPREFVVRVNHSTEFVALGTAYSVEKLASAWTLEVYQGVVGVRGGALSGTAPVHAGWGLKYQDNKLSRYRLPPSLQAGQPDWSSHRIQFDATRLEQAIRQINRYSPQPLVLEDKGLAGFAISGVFNLQDVEDFVQSVEGLTQTRSVKTPEGILLGLPRGAGD